jgi:hypothetical protein
VINRDDLREELAQQCHKTWMWQNKRAKQLETEGTPEPRADPNDPNPTKHDYERAEELIEMLERLGIYP